MLAVRTTVLSTRWNNIWTSVPNLEFTDGHKSFSSEGKGEDPFEGCPSRFKTFVDRVLFFCNSSDIQKFTLFCNYQSHFTRVDGWVCTAARRNVVELDFHHCLDKPRTTFEFPQCIFMCKTLVILKIFSNCTACSPPLSGCFPSLRFLHVTLHYPDNSVERLISCCPVPEALTIDGTLGSFANLVLTNVLEALTIWFEALTISVLEALPIWF